VTVNRFYHLAKYSIEEHIMELEDSLTRSTNLTTGSTQIFGSSSRAVSDISQTTGETMFQDTFLSWDKLVGLNKQDLKFTKEQDTELLPPIPTLIRSSPQRLLARCWRIEALCCLISIASTVAIVATLWTYNHRPLPEWPRHVTINSLISVFVILLKTPMLLVIAEGTSIAV